MYGMSSGLPENPKNDKEQDAGGETRVLNIDSLHLHSNEIDSLNRLAKTDPDLARIVVDQKDRFDKRGHASFRFGVISASLLLLGVLVASSYVLVKMGIILSLILIAFIIAAAVLIRVLLTGEWSDTSAIGSIINGIVRILGGSKKE